MRVLTLATLIVGGLSQADALGRNFNVYASPNNTVTTFETFFKDGADSGFVGEKVTGLNSGANSAMLYGFMRVGVKNCRFNGRTGSSAPIVCDKQ